MSVTATITGDRELLAKFSNVSARLKAEIARAVVRSGALVDRQAKINAPVRTGRLRRSITESSLRDDGARLSVTVGTNVEYAHAVEYGFHGIESVREHLRHCTSGKLATVRAHERHANQPEHSYLRTALAQMQASIRAEMQEALDRVLK